LSWPVAEASVFDFHEVAFAPLVTAVLFERLSAQRQGGRLSARRHGCGRLWHVVAAAVALLAVKEDMGLLLAGLGVAIAVRGPARQRLLGLGFVVGGL